MNDARTSRRRIWAYAAAILIVIALTGAGAWVLLKLLNRLAILTSG